jgi:hypothetical protein
MPDLPHPAALVDLDRYPILDPASPARRELARRCRAGLDATGACELEGFLRPEATARMVRESESLAPSAHRNAGKATPYLEIPDPAWPEDHPRRLFGPYGVDVIAYDRVPGSHALRRLYEWDPLMEFVAAAIGAPRLFRYADPLGALNVAVMGEGDLLQWHYDQTDFVVSLALRGAEAGGDFEYVPLIRSGEDERYDAVRRLLLGDERDVRRVPMRPGTLLLFEGRCSIHRVSPIRGATTRLVALLAYDTKPGTCASEVLQRARYGRVVRPASVTTVLNSTGEVA